MDTISNSWMVMAAPRHIGVAFGLPRYEAEQGHGLKDARDYYDPSSND